MLNTLYRHNKHLSLLIFIKLLIPIYQDSLSNDQHDKRKNSAVPTHTTRCHQIILTVVLSEAQPGGETLNPRGLKGGRPDYGGGTVFTQTVTHTDRMRGAVATDSVATAPLISLRIIKGPTPSSHNSL